MLSQGEVSSVSKDFQAVGQAQVMKVDASLGLVFGWAIVCKDGGKDYIDVQNDHIPEDSMLAAGMDFMKNSRRNGEMHTRIEAGDILFAFPMTTEIAKAFNFDTHGKTGLIIGAKPDAAQLAKFVSGELTGFSIGGVREEDVDAEVELVTS